MATHSSILAWEILWTEEPGNLQSMGSQRVGHDRAHRHATFLLLLLTGIEDFVLRVYTSASAYVLFTPDLSSYTVAAAPPTRTFFVGIFLFDPYCFWKPFHLFSGLEFQLSSSFAKSNFGVYISLFPYCFWIISIKRRQKCQLWKQDRSSLNLNTFLSFIFLLLSSLYIFLFLTFYFILECSQLTMLW